MRDFTEVKRRLQILDPLYGAFELTELQTALALTPEVQRLRNIRMCNINSLLVTGASEIARFEHTLGVLILAEEWAAINRLASKDRNVLAAAALLHDMQTPPFGHSLQYVLEDNRFAHKFEHQLISTTGALYHQDAPAAAQFAGQQFRSRQLLGNLWDEVSAAVAGKGPFGALMNGSMDLDNLDNVIRLAVHAGLAGSDDVASTRELVRHLTVVDGTIAVPEKYLANVGQWQAARKRLYDFLLLDWAEFSAKAMLTRAIEEAAAIDVLSVDSWLLTDAALLETLERDSVGKSSLLKSLITRLRLGDLYFPIALLYTESVQAYSGLAGHDAKRDLEKEIAKELKQENAGKHTFLFHPILDKGKTERAVDVVSLERRVKTTIGRSSNRILLGLFSTHETTTSTRQLAVSKLSQLLGTFGIRNILPVEDPFELHCGRVRQQSLI